MHLSAFLLLLVSIAFVSCSSINDEAWNYYHQAVLKALRPYGSPGQVLTMVKNPISKSNFIFSTSNQAQLPAGINYEYDNTLTVCNKLENLIKKRGTPQTFLKFKRTKCVYQVSSGRGEPGKRWTITGSSLATPTKVLHHRQTFIKDGQTEVKMEAFHPKKSLRCDHFTLDREFLETAVSVMLHPSKWNEFERCTRQMNEILRNDHDDDLVRNFGNISDRVMVKCFNVLMQKPWTSVQPKLSPKNFIQLGPQVRTCLQDVSQFVEHYEPLSLKEFNLDYKIDMMEIIDLFNLALDQTGPSVQYGLVPRRALIAHNPRARLSLSHKDFNSIQAAWNTHKVIQLGGIKFDSMTVVRAGDDDDRSSSSWLSSVSSSCIVSCIYKYSADKSGTVSQELNFHTCLCQCPNYGFNQNPAQCITSTRRFQVELHSKEPVVVGVISDKM